MQALVSIHDVMPNTLSRVRDLLVHMAHLEKPNISLLVVPGLDWRAEQLAVLRNLQNEGYTLAGHGWEHTTRQVSGVYHKLHSALISRHAAEHLSLSTAEIRKLINDCYQWFQGHALKTPDMYVPPAWAMGSISKQDLSESPFQYFETTVGIYDSDSDKQVALPLIGFEADNAFRYCSLKLWNAFNKKIGTPAKPTRVSIHPYDGALLLRKSLFKTLGQVKSAVDYHSLF